MMPKIKLRRINVHKQGLTQQPCKVFSVICTESISHFDHAEKHISMRATESKAILEAPIRIDRYLAGRFDYLSRSAWQLMIKDGRVSVNGSPVKANHIIEDGDLIRFAGGFRGEPPVDSAWSLLYEDEVTVAISKSGDLPVHPSGRYCENSLLHIAAGKFGTLHPVNRIDRETSGIVLFAKTSAAASRYQKNLSKAHKHYLAIVRGDPPGSFSCELPLGPAHPLAQDGDEVVRKKRAAYEGADEKAFTNFRLLQKAGGYALLEALPETGRLHQIRAHLEACGYPIVGDKLYGGDERLFLKFIESGMTDSLLQKLELPRCALHAHRLAITHADSNETIVICAPLPSDMRGFIESEFGEPYNMEY